MSSLPTYSGLMSSLQTYSGLVIMYPGKVVDEDRNSDFTQSNCNANMDYHILSDFIHIQLLIELVTYKLAGNWILTPILDILFALVV